MILGTAFTMVTPEEEPNRMPPATVVVALLPIIRGEAALRTVVLGAQFYRKSGKNSEIYGKDYDIQGFYNFLDFHDSRCTLADNPPAPRSLVIPVDSTSTIHVYVQLFMK